MTLTHDFDHGAEASGGDATENWQNPRVPEIPVAFRNGYGQHCAARLNNLTPDGLQVRCNVATAQIIHPLGGTLLNGNQPLLHATAVMPLSAGRETLSVGVRLIYSMIADTEPSCLLGFHFLELRPKARRIIDTFFAEQRLAITR